MEKLSNEVAEISAEYALHDALENICQNLSLRDLINFSLVSRSWHRAALRQMSKRGPERIFIPHMYNKYMDRFVLTNTYHHLFDVLCAKPYMVLLFIGSPSNYPCGDCTERRLLKVYNKCIPHTLVTMGVRACMIGKSNIYSKSVKLSRGIMGLLLPLSQNIEIKFSTTLSIHDLLEELTPKNNQLNTTIIMFCHSNLRSPHHVLRHIRYRFPQQSYSLCGGAFGQLLIHHENNDESDNARIPYIVISMTGSNLRSWSVTIDFHDPMKLSMEILSNLRNNIRLKSKTIGLACYSKNIKGYKPMDIIKSIFPNISFTGLCNYGNVLFGVNSISDDDNQLLVHYNMTMSIMILTYD